MIRNRSVPVAVSAEQQLKRQVTALYELYSGIFGSDRMVLKAGKLDALTLMSSEKLPERVLALQKLVFEDPTIVEIPSINQIPAILEQLEEEIAEVMARQTLEDR